MQIPENPFDVNELYQQSIDDIAMDRLKSKTKEKLVEMRMIFVAYDANNKPFANSGQYLLAVNNEISKRNSSFENRVLFWAAVIAAIFSVIAEWSTLRSWLPTFRRDAKPASSQSPKSHSSLPQTPLKPPANDAGGANH